MASSKEDLAWGSLVHRSLEAWDALNPKRALNPERPPMHEEDALQSCTGLDDFLSKAEDHLMFWFFQRRGAFLSQKTMQKWSRDRLEDYVLLPATPGFVLRTSCFFVSHFWHLKDNPDPDGKYLRLLQGELQTQPWSYVWVDWTCAPQEARSRSEEIYFLRTLQTMSGIIRNSGFIWFYPPFEPRLWILYEVAEYTLTAENEWKPTEDVREFKEHVKEMLRVGVRSTLDRHGYRCTNPRDKEFITSWLEVLVLLRTLRLDVDDIRRLLDHLTWKRGLEIIIMNTISGYVHFSRYEGTLILRGECHTFTPFPKLVSRLSA